MSIERLKQTQRALLHAMRRAATDRLGFWKHRPRVLANSVPKSGTNLLRRCLELMPGMMDTDISMNRPSGLAELEANARRVYRGSFLRGHTVFTPEYHALFSGLGFKTILMVRDPRDVAVSLMHWVTYKHKAHRLRPYFSSLPDDHQRLMEVIRGVPAEKIGDGRGLENVNDYVGAFLPWLDHGSLLIRFEDLIGADGGGSRDRQLAEVEKLARHLDLPLSTAVIESVASRIFNPRGHTFRKGQIGDWVNHFSPEHRAAFKETAGELLVRMGYEKGLDW